MSLGLNGERRREVCHRGINILALFPLSPTFIVSGFCRLTIVCLKRKWRRSLGVELQTKRVRRDVADGMSRGKSNCRRDLRKARHCSPRVATLVVRVAAVAFPPFPCPASYTPNARNPRLVAVAGTANQSADFRAFFAISTRDRADSLDLSAPATHVASAAPRSPGDHAQAQAQAVARGE